LMTPFSGKRIVLTGHTGFKGSWLACWLSRLGAEVIGISDRVPTEPSHFKTSSEDLAGDLRIDVRESSEILQVLEQRKPEFVFHLAAQPIVFESYENPLETFSVNAMGTASVLEALRVYDRPCTAIMITSDKCYDNVEWTQGYKETDRLGGKDPYSGSKGAAELVIRSYAESYFKKSESKVLVAVGRAGNVIGGGDWAPFRIVPDCARSWAVGEKPEIRSPMATRPWQHVLEPLSGYLSLAASLSENASLNGEAFNFGPPATQNHSVEELVDEIMLSWPGTGWLDKSSGNKMHPEAGLLKLCCDKALHQLSWEATLDFKETARWTADWYRTYYQSGPQDAKELTFSQIDEYMALSVKRGTFDIGLK
jgi:CDP-glucose 4,6-dehydratase